MAPVIFVLVLLVGLPLVLASIIGLRNRRHHDDEQVLVSGMQHRIDVDTQVHSMGLSSTGYRPERPHDSEHP